MKRWFSMLLVMCMILSLTGCGGEKVTVPDDNYRTYYEVFVRSFYDSDGDGIGDIAGLTQKLDYIEELGFNGIWLMPLMPSMTYHKYDVTDYYSIDSEYGTLEEFRTFLEEAHKRGIHVIMDMVFNHTSSEHPWFKEAVSYLKTLEATEEPDAAVCPYVEYYHFSRERGSGYSVVDGTDWYYESVFWYGMPDLDLYNEEVRRELEKIADFWLSMGVDGFRLDAAKEYVTGNTGKNVEILKWYVDYVKAGYPDAYLVAEVWDTLETITAFYESGIDSIFNYPFGNNDGKLVSVVKKAGDGKSGASFATSLEAVEQKFKQVNPDMIDAPFLSNHDTGRIAGFLAPSQEKIKFGGALNLLMSGSTFVYYGEEIGMKGSGADENKRAPMRWAAEGSEGITDPPPNMGDVKQKYDTLDIQMEDGDSIYNYYKNAIAIRNKYPEIARGSQSAVTLSDGDIIVIAKTYGEEVTYVVANNSEAESKVSLTGSELAGCKVKSSLVTTPSTQKGSISLSGDTLTLPPFGVCILK